MGQRGGRPEAEKAREHERRAWELRQKSWTHARIAAELGLDRSTVTKILDRVSQRVLKQLNADVAAHKVEQHARLDFLIDEALQAWERSKQPAEKTTREYVTQPAGDSPPPADAATPGQLRPAGQEEVTHEVQGRDGDVRFLDQARVALADQRKIWGIDAPQKVAPTTPDGQGEYAGGGMTDEQCKTGLRRMLERLGIPVPPEPSPPGGAAAPGEQLPVAP